MKFYLIDGYNVIFSSRLKNKSLEEARTELLQICKAQFGSNFLIVYDGREGIVSDKKEPRVVFVKGKSADDYIKKFLEEKRDRSFYVVISRDRSLVDYCRYLGAKSKDPDFIFTRPQTRRGEERGLSLEEERRITNELKKLWGIED